MSDNARALVLMNKENGLLTNELGSYEIDGNMDCIFKAYVEDGKVKLFLSTKDDVSDEEFEQLFEKYETEEYEELGATCEDIDDEYNPVWLVSFPFENEHDVIEETLSEIISIHNHQIEDILYS